MTSNVSGNPKIMARSTETRINIFEGKIKKKKKEKKNILIQLFN